MTFVRVKGFKIFADRHGRWRCYHRKTKIPIDLRKAPLGSADFFAICEKIAARNARRTTKSNTLGMLIEKYRESPAYSILAPRTKETYQRAFDYLQPIADTPLGCFDTPLIVGIRDKAFWKKGRKFANDLKARFSFIFDWGRQYGYVKENFASDIKDIRRPKGTPDANRPWTDQERHVVMELAPAHMKPALGVMMYTGLGPDDTLKLPRSFYHDGAIATKRGKTGEPVFAPAIRPLVEILERAPAHSAPTLCANSLGHPWTGDGFRASWRTFRKKLEKDGRIGPGLTLYGLRHTMAVILREMGRHERDIADVLGQNTIEMARHYAKGADLRRKMRGIGQDLEAELDERSTNFANREDW
ncbi:tyrosine-type recombinase/integrase [Microvirga sp. M2]|uniref:tyrosine-type recombinase/integrase n=1 Tax=Microvirga sp. M2 TaxID=3073270 RepID=UPI0039C1DDF4